jgi:hypothetical protein
MSTRSWIGVGFAAACFGLFALFIAKHEVTAVAGLTFGGGLLFAGLLIDPAEFRAMVALIRGKPESSYPPPPGGQDGKFPTGEGQ